MIGRSQSVRLPIVSILLLATLGTIVLTSVLLWPLWQKHRAVLALVHAIKRNDEEAIHGNIKAVDTLEAWESAVSGLTELLHDEDFEVRKKAIGYIEWWHLRDNTPQESEHRWIVAAQTMHQLTRYRCVSKTRALSN
jgi:hypothetical protein